MKTAGGRKKSPPPPSRIRYKDFVQHLPLGVYRTTPEGRIVEANHVLARILGFNTIEELKAINAADLYVDPEARLRHIRSADRAGTHIAEFELKRRSGRALWVRDFIRAVKPARGAVRFYDGALEDISERRRILDALRTSEANHRAFIEGLPDMMFIMNRDGTILDYKFERPDMLAVPPEVFLGRKPFGFMPPEIARLAEKRVREALQTMSVQQFEFAMPGPSGGKIQYLEGYLKALDDRQLVLFLRDVTERKKAEKIKAAAFKISEAAISAKSLDGLFRSIHGIIGDLLPARNFYIALYDHKSGILSFPYFVDEYDETPAPRRMKRGLTEYVLRTGQPLLASAAALRELEEKGEIEPIGTDSVDWLGAPLLLDDRVIGVLTVQSYESGVRYGEEEKDILRFVSDQVAMVIRRKQDEEALQERERFLTSVFESLQDGISVLDRDMRILRVNRVMEQRHGQALPLEGKKCYEAYRGRDRACEVCPTRTTLETGKAANAAVPLAEPGDKTGRWIDLFSYPLVDQRSGQVIGVIENVRDITDRMKSDEALKASLQEKEVLLREIHHRVKNNLQVISSLLNLQARHLGGDALKEAFRASQRRIRSMALVHEKLYMAKNLSRIEFGEYLRSLTSQLAEAYHLDPSLVRLRVAAEEIFLNINTAVPCGLIVSELVSNAARHAFPDGRKGEIEISLRQEEGGRYRLAVRDDGIGMPASVDLRSIDTFGLQIVLILVSQLDGEIELDRERGTEFRILFKEITYKISL